MVQQTPDGAGPTSPSTVGQDPEKVWTPGGRLRLETLAEHLLDAGGRVMEREYPDWARTLRSLIEAGTDLDEATQTAPPDGSDQTMAVYRTLLGQVYDLQQGIFQFRRAWRLMNVRLDAESLERLEMTAGEWWWYHDEAWSVMMYSVIDRAEALVIAAYRHLRGGPDVREQYSTEKQLLAVLGDLKKRAGTIRHPVAHGVHAGNVGPITGIAEDGVWEHFSVLRLWTTPAHALRVFGDPADVERRSAERFKVSLAVISAVDKLVGQLDASINWDFVHALKSKPRKETSQRTPNRA